MMRSNLILSNLKLTSYVSSQSQPCITWSCYVQCKRWMSSETDINNAAKTVKTGTDVSSPDASQPEVKPFRVMVPFKRRFLDSMRLVVQGGRGGNGLKAYGGIGGKGGDVILEAQEDAGVNCLKNLKAKYAHERIKAGDGGHSAKYCILGPAGQDKIVKVPMGTTIVAEHKRVLGELNQPGDKVVVAVGGRGGDFSNNHIGQRGQFRQVNIDVKLIADVGLIGYPNAGKSTLLKALSRAKPKIAPYPFTTMAPNIGVCEYDDMRQIKVADLPGLIEGAANNFGLGHSFLKHIIRTHLLLFVVDVQGFVWSSHWARRTAFETLLLLIRELELYDDTLLNKPSLLVITKMDTKRSQKNYNQFLDDMKRFQESVEAGKPIPEAFPNVDLPSRLMQFDDILPICAQTAYNIIELRHRIREVIDLNFEIERTQEKGLTPASPTSFRSILDREQNRKITDDILLT